MGEFMHVVVLGAGVVGVTTAYYLARRGHTVTVLEQQPDVGMETSYANAGMITIGYAAPWSGPGVPMKSIKWAFQGDSPLKFSPRLDPAMAAWMWQWWRHCSMPRYLENKSRMVRLAAYSLSSLQSLRSETALHYDQRTLGTLQLFRAEAQLDAVKSDLLVLDDLGVNYKLLDAQACRQVEPGLVFSQQHIAGGLQLPDDETGDCFKFTQEIARHAQALGVQFRFNTKVNQLVHQQDRITAVDTSEGPVTADAFVMALGCFSVGLLKPLGIRIPVYPVKGYSLTIPIKDATRAPQSTILDESSKVAITRMGDRIRAGGVAEITGFDTSLPKSRKQSIEKVVQALFPGAGDMADAEFWTGLRPVTPDGPPLLGPTKIKNLFLNTGHGSFGWTMACGSARVLTDLVSGNTPEIKLDGLTIARYQ